MLSISVSYIHYFLCYFLLFVYFLSLCPSLAFSYLSFLLSCLPCPNPLSLSLHSALSILDFIVALGCFDPQAEGKIGIASSEISELRLLSSSDISASSLTRDMGLLPLVVTM